MNCYVSKISACEGPLSGEHIISKSILQDFEFSVKGLNWCRDEPKKIGINSFTTNILCKKHNSNLTDLDQAALDVWLILKEWTRIGNIAVSRHKTERHFMAVNALAFERWCCKTIVNVLLSGSYPNFKSWDPPDYLIKYIFGLNSLPKDHGLSFNIAIGREDRFRANIGMAVLSKDETVIGGLINFSGLKLILSWELPVDKLEVPIQFIDHDLNSKLLFHVSKIFHESKTNIIFDWTGKYDNNNSKIIRRLRNLYKTNKLK